MRRGEKKPDYPRVKIGVGQQKRERKRKRKIKKAKARCSSLEATLPQIFQLYNETEPRFFPFLINRTDLLFSYIYIIK